MPKRRTTPDWAFQVKVVYKKPKLTQREQDRAFDQLVDFAEAHGMGVGGGYGAPGYELIVTSTKDSVVLGNEHRRLFTAWLQERDDIGRFSVGRLKDANKEDAFL